MNATPLRWVCGVIWNFSEFYGIPLGRLAPYVFGGMIGSWPRRMTREDEAEEASRRG